MSEAALLAHVVSQIQSNVDFLVAQNYISASDAATISAKLPSSGNQFNSVAAPARRNTPTASPVVQPRTFQARALWPYNENGQEPDDLSFSTGDIIEIVAETNADWWTGRIHGKEALFPSSYVERIADSAPAYAARSSPAPRSVPPISSAPAPSAMPANTRNVPPRTTPVGGNKPKSAYKPFGASLHGTDVPPPASAGEVNSVGLQAESGQEAKKSKYGKYGNTMAHSAAGGAGFAIGGGLVRAIF